ncbi:hypothetical protein LINPERPRIM_LOCUS10102 [Linum perenne]
MGRCWALAVKPPLEI